MKPSRYRFAHVAAVAAIFTFSIVSLAPPAEAVPLSRGSAITSTAPAHSSPASPLASLLGVFVVFGMANISDDTARALFAASNSLLGRSTGPELFQSGNFDPTTPGVINIGRVLNLNRPLEAILIRLRGRIAVTVANYTAVAPEAPMNLLQKIILQGIHKDIGSTTPINISGATAFFWSWMFEEQGSRCLINNVNFPDASVARGGFQPLTSPFLGTTAGSPYDVELIYVIPMGPWMGISQSLKKQMTNFAYMPLDWADTLNLQLQFGDKSALGDPTGATVAFTAFGSGAGNWTWEVHNVYTLLGQFANQIRGGVTYRNEVPLSNQTALASAVMLSTLQKQITTNLLLKSGLIQTAGLTAGVDTLASVSDTILDKTQIIVDNKAVRNNQANPVAKAWKQRQFGTSIPQGYYLESFVDGQNPLLAFRGDGLNAGSQFQVNSDIVSASANNRIRMIQEYIVGGPFPAQR